MYGEDPKREERATLGQLQIIQECPTSSRLRPIFHFSWFSRWCPQWTTGEPIQVHPDKGPAPNHRHGLWTWMEGEGFHLLCCPFGQVVLLSHAQSRWMGKAPKERRGLGPSTQQCSISQIIFRLKITSFKNSYWKALTQHTTVSSRF